ncbi:hypothetical protein M9Y10_000674 [Tritrichomonas musculus]|uniref:GOLD domain-containing protein n=1 Tax=Tritrichomonas musculus TaxID=1915356 RepID=A0ABR2L4V6_9EUKA
MINEQNFQFYLRWLVQVSNSQPITDNNIPKVFQDFFTLPALSQALNISVANPLSVDWSNVENYINQNTFTDFVSLAEGIRDNFQTDIDKLYASYYFVTHYIQFDWDRYNSEDPQVLTIEDIFTQKKGISVDYSNFLIELAKSSGIISDNIQIYPFTNASKGINWNSYQPPPTPEIDHDDVYIDIGGQKFISEPSLGSGYLDDDHQFNFQYKKSNFLIPYLNALLLHYPENAIEEFTYDQFVSLNEPNFEKELSFESNPFQKITVENGYYEMQFSFLQPVDSIRSEISMLVNDDWSIKDDELVSLTCLAKDLPNRRFSLSSELRCRYKMAVSFPEIGNYEVKVTLNDRKLFNVYFNVTGIKEKMTFGIPDSLIEKSGFHPIVPSDELSTVTNGYARIRFVINLNSSAVIAKLFKIKEETFERDEKTVENCCRFFSVNLPFELEEYEHLKGYLVENWILVEFPEDGRWEVKIFFDADQTYGITYYFDVTGTCVHNIYPIFDLPKNRTFSHFPVNWPLVSLEPSTQSVIVNQSAASFHVFSEEELKLSFKHENDDSTIEPTLVGVKETSDNTSKDREYSVTFPEDGVYRLEIWEEDQFVGTQNYFVGEIEQIGETQEEKDLMENVKTVLTEKLDYCRDIPQSIREDVERLLKESNTDQQNEEEGQNEGQIENGQIQGQIDESQINDLVEGQISSLLDQGQNGEIQQNEEGQINDQIDQEPQVQINIPPYDDSPRSPRSRGQPSYPSSPRSTMSSSRGSNRPPLKKRPIKTRQPVLYTPPVYKSVEMTSELQALKEKAKKEEPLVNVSSETLEDLLYILNQEKKSYAKDHLYKNGLKCNSMIAHVTKYYELAKRKENQDFERQKFAEINKQFEDSLQSFDQETKKLEKELLAHQNDKRNQLKAAIEDDLTQFDEHWNSAKKQRTYNHSTNNLNALRSKLSFLLVDGRFKDAEEVQKQVNERTAFELANHTEIMKNDHDTSLRFLREKHIDEIDTFEKNCLVELEKFRQDRTKLRQSYLNRQLKLKTKEEIISDPNKLWMHGQTERMGNTLKNSLNRGATVNQSSKMKRADIKETDAVVLNLPPLESSRKPQKKAKKKKEDE